MNEPKQEYLGDGVYAKYDGYHIWLSVDRMGRTEQVALEPPVFAALLRYAATLGFPGTKELAAMAKM